MAWDFRGGGGARDMHLAVMAALALVEMQTPTRPPRRDPPPRPPAERPQGDVYFRNCSEARAAGREDIRRGQPGYRPALDRDNDGVACESR